MTITRVAEDLKRFKTRRNTFKTFRPRTLSFTEISRKHTASACSDKGRLIRATTDVVLSTNCVTSLAEYKGDSGKKILTKESHQSDCTRANKGAIEWFNMLEKSKSKSILSI